MEPFDFSLSKSSFLEDKIDIEEKNSLCQASCIDKDVDCDFKDVLPLPQINMSLFDSSIHFQDGGFNETSTSSSFETEDDEMVLEIQTPTNCIFDPFAPGTDDLMLAPKKKKFRESYVPLQRRLDFDDEGESEENMKYHPLEDFEEEEKFFESFFNSLLEFIISTQLKEFSAVAMVKNSDFFGGWKTPLSLPLLSSVADTCPPAPMRPSLSFERQRHKIRRKLDFGSN